jgi:PKD repeat protein
MHSFDLGSANLPSGGAALYVKATGKASIRNVMAAPLAYRAGDKNPTATLNVSMPSDLTVATSVSASDADGSIASTSIDFGDGTVLQGPSATHKYAKPGRYIVTATATDNQGASGVAVTAVEAKAVASGVTIFTPSNSATVNWPTMLTASANSGAPIKRMNVLIEGQPSYAVAGGVLNAALKVFTGSHTVTVQAIDASGATSQASVNVVAEPGDLPPAAKITVRTLANAAPHTVLACGATSSDPDGYILTWHWRFSDGAEAFTPAAVHTFGGAGSYSVTLGVMDQYGATNSQTQSFSADAAAVTLHEAPSSTPAGFMAQPAVNAPRTPEPLRRP